MSAVGRMINLIIPSSGMDMNREQAKNTVALVRNSVFLVNPILRSI